MIVPCPDKFQSLLPEVVPVPTNEVGNYNYIRYHYVVVIISGVLLRTSCAPLEIPWKDGYGQLQSRPVSAEADAAAVPLSGLTALLRELSGTMLCVLGLCVFLCVHLDNFVLINF